MVGREVYLGGVYPGYVPGVYLGGVYPGMYTLYMPPLLLWWYPPTLVYTPYPPPWVYHHATLLPGVPQFMPGR